MRFLDRLEHEDPRRERYLPVLCAVRGCATMTREKKPYCSAHVLMMPYAATVAAGIKAADAELQRVRRRGKEAVDVNGSHAQTILSIVESHGVVTMERLRKQAQTGDATRFYVEALGLTVQEMGSRGKFAVSA